MLIKRWKLSDLGASAGFVFSALLLYGYLDFSTPIYEAQGGPTQELVTNGSRGQSPRDIATATNLPLVQGIALPFGDQHYLPKFSASSVGLAERAPPFGALPSGAPPSGAPPRFPLFGPPSSGAPPSFPLFGPPSSGFPPIGFPPSGFPPSGFPPTGAPPAGAPPAGAPPAKAPPLDFNGAKCKGQKYYKEMQDSYAADAQGNRRQGREFGQQDINNGWSVVINRTGGDPGSQWDAPFKDRITGGPTPEDLRDQGYYITIAQDKTFRTDQGRLVREFFKEASYSAFYLPAASTIVVSYSDSPLNELKKVYKGELSDETIKISVPPLNRLSDSLWTIWSGITWHNARNLRYIGRDKISNPDTYNVMRSIFDTTRRSRLVPWPGLTFGMNTDNGLAMLGTPNGVATAWLLIDHHTILGRREPTVTIWSYSLEEGSSHDFDLEYMVLFDLGLPLP
ncbi:MAG: hypothetical protein Q9218_003418 [Villophora microphyllina]